jgi:hypothetical protein
MSVSPDHTAMSGTESVLQGTEGHPHQEDKRVDGTLKPVLGGLVVWTREDLGCITRMIWYRGIVFTFGFFKGFQPLTETKVYHYSHM